MPGVLSQSARELLYQGRLAGESLPELASELHCSVTCVRKWWRRMRDQGLSGLGTRRVGRPSSGVLCTFAPEVRQEALRLKHCHPRWGADRVLLELRTDPRFGAQRLPGRSCLTVFYQQTCPECVAKHTPQPAPTPRPPASTAPHQLWQLDAQENIRLQDGSIATICSVRDPYSGAMLASHVFSVKSAHAWRKLTWAEFRQVVREAASEWGTLPEALQTDNEVALAGSPTDPFPSLFSLWLVGCGIEHRVSRPGLPTDNAEIERNHRTLDDWALDPPSLANVPSLQLSVTHERQLYNTYFPTRASNCGRRPPLVAHPGLRNTPRPYDPGQEAARFDIARVWHHLASFAFRRIVSSVGQVSLGCYTYSIGLAWAKQSIIACFDPELIQWVFFLSKTRHDYPEIAHVPIKGLSTAVLTGPNP